MVLFIILICLVLQRYCRFNNTLLLPLFRAYTINNLMVLQKFNIQRPLVLILLCALPLLLLVWLINMVLQNRWFNVLDFLFQIFILFYCIDFYSLKIKLAHYFDAKDREDEQAAFRYSTEFLEDASVHDGVILARAITKKIFLDCDRYIFSVLFWYIVLGPLGAVAYALFRSWASKTSTETISYPELRQAAVRVHGVLDWLPTRIIGFTYLLVGHFNYGFSYWRKHVFDSVKYSSDFAANVGLAALECDPENAISADADENRKALKMVERTFLLWIAIIAVFTLISWIA